jgi:hypothetical protein
MQLYRELDFLWPAQRRAEDCWDDFVGQGGVLIG